MLNKRVATGMIYMCLLLSSSVLYAAKLQKYDAQTIYAPEQAIVIIKLNNLSYINISRLQKASSSVVNELTIMRPMRSLLPYSYSQSMYVLRPGIYYISFLEYLSDRHLYHTIDDGLSKEGKILYGAYDIQPGAVVYLGDYDCSWKSNSRVSKLSITNNLSEVKHDLHKAGYEELAEKVTTTKFYAAGSDIQQMLMSNNLTN